MRPKRVAEASPAKEFDVSAPKGELDSSTNLRRITELWQAGMQAFDFLGIAWLVCDSTGQLLGANPLALRILSVGDGLSRNSDGGLEVTRGPKGRLAEAVQRAAGGVSPGDKSPGDAYLAVKRGLGKRPFTVLVHRVSAVLKSEPESRAVALLLVLNPLVSAQTVDGDLQQVYGLTAREASVARMLMDGHALRDCCDRLGITRSTACTHLRRMFKKTRVHRQSEMVSVLLKTIGLVGTRDEEPHQMDPGRDNGLEPAGMRTARRLDRQALLPLH